MTTCTVAMLQQAYEESPKQARAIEELINYHTNRKMRAGRFDPAAAQAWIDKHKADHLDHKLRKWERPWDIVNLTAKLDPKQPWVGVEYETGYQSNEAYQRVVNFLWQHVPWTAIDVEGGGNYPCEITFSPVNMNDFMGDDYCMDRLLRFMNGDGDAAKHGDGVFVGTHLNASTPAYRAMDDGLVTSFNASLRQLLKQVGKGNNVPLFGRVPYGYNNPMGHGDTKWIEFKLFKSTGDVETWQKYKGVMARLISLIEYFARNPSAMPAANINDKGERVDWPGHDDLTLVKSNVADYLLGNFNDLKDLKVEYAKRSTIRSYSALDSTYHFW